MRTIGYISTAAFLGALAAGFAVFVKLLPGHSPLRADAEHVR